MVGRLLLVAWPDGNQVRTSFRYAQYVGSRLLKGRTLIEITEDTLVHQYTMEQHKFKKLITRLTARTLR
jgi:Cytochrome domain of cellobiose dehydrogenase